MPRSFTWSLRFYILTSFSNLRFSNTKQSVSKANQETEILQKPTISKETPAVFGEHLNQFPRSVTGVDKMLIAAHYVQANDPDNMFTTRLANDLLKAQGVKVANATDCVKKSMKTKRVFAIEKGKYRVSKLGLEHLENLLSSDR